MGYKIFIPARYNSSRLPGKLLLKVKGKTILEHAYHCAQQSGADDIVIATDHYNIADLAHKIGAKVVITPAECPNGTARLSYAINDPKNKFIFDDNDIIVNLQADEIVMPAAYIDLVAYNLANNHGAAIATLAKPLTCHKELINPNVVKVVKNNAGMAMYFSRAPISYVRDGFSNENLTKYQHWQHIGLYAYRVNFLREYNNLKPTEIEQAESLEQLRALCYGYSIYVGDAQQLPTYEINTIEDYKAAEDFLTTVN